MERKARSDCRSIGGHQHRILLEHSLSGCIGKCVELAQAIVYSREIGDGTAPGSAF